MLPYFRHRSPYYYLAWAGLYLVLGILALAGVSIPKFFGKNLAADVLINMVSPFILAGGAMLASVIKDRLKGIPWLAWPFLAGLWALTIWMPGALLFKLGGWGVLLSALLFFSRVDWFFLAGGGDKHTMVMFARGLFGPFVFFAPALIVSCLWVGRNVISVNQTDWIPQFGVIYFGIQAWFEEFMLRRAERKMGS